MAKAKNSYEELTREADKRLAKVKGRQLSMLPDEQGETIESVSEGKPVGRPKGAVNKGSSQLRKYLEAKGYRMPEDVIVQLAGLDDPKPPLVKAMEQVEEVLAWAYDGAKDKKGKAQMASPEERVRLLVSFLAVQQRAAEAMLPYGTPKAGSDTPSQPPVQVFVPGAPSQPAEPRDVTPKPQQIGGRMVPADVAWESQQNQQVSEDGAEDLDG